MAGELADELVCAPAFAGLARSISARVRVFRIRMNLGDIATGELHERRPSVVGRIGVDQHARAGKLRLRHGRIDVEHLVTCQLSPVRVGEMAIRHEDGDVAER